MAPGIPEALRLTPRQIATVANERAALHGGKVPSKPFRGTIDDLYGVLAAAGVRR